MNTPLDLAQLKKLADEAQSGPWYPANDGIYTDDLDYDHKIELSKENASFIAASRTALPELIAELERLEKQEQFDSGRISVLLTENDSLRKQNDKLREQRNIYHTICDENDLVNYHRHIKSLDAEIEEIK